MAGDGAFPEGAVLPGQDCQVCDTDGGSGMWVNAIEGIPCDGGACVAGMCHPCGLDGTLCDGGVCVAGVCQFGCWTDAGYQAPTAVPGLDCMGCVPDASMTQLTEFPEWSTCAGSLPRGSFFGVCSTNGGRVPNQCTCVIRRSVCDPSLVQDFPCCGKCLDSGVCCTASNFDEPCVASSDCCDNGVCVLPDDGGFGTCQWDGG